VKLGSALHTATVRRRGLERAARSGRPDDLALVERARNGDRTAFEELVRLHAVGVHAVVVRLCADAGEAEEVTQETFLRAWRGINGFHGDSQLFTWLYRIAVNEAKRRIERRAEQDASSLEEDRGRDAADWRPPPDVAAEQRDLRAALEAAVRALHPDYRAPLILRDIEGIRTAEAARILELSEGAFKSRLHRARQAVRGAIADYLGEQR
jgi:RNA polymerase sigma-70 factor (ECF subfamily)